MNKTITIDAETGATIERDMTDAEIAERNQIKIDEQRLIQDFNTKAIKQFNEQVLLNTLLQTFVGYLGLHMQGALPVVTFADFMGEVFTGYMANGGKVES